MTGKLLQDDKVVAQGNEFVDAADVGVAVQGCKGVVERSGMPGVWHQLEHSLFSASASVLDQQGSPRAFEELGAKLR